MKIKPNNNDLLKHIGIPAILGVLVGGAIGYFISLLILSNVG